MRTQMRAFASAVKPAVVMNVILTMLAIGGGLVLLKPERTRRRGACEEKPNLDLAPRGPPGRRAAQIDRIAKADGDACAHEAAAAIEAVLDQRCPELKRSFWNAIDKLYRLDNAPTPLCPVAPAPEARMPA